ncbi:MAG: HD domain-containing protein [Coriobacteriia bacterium]|jgi:poly(A) polymerase|nr:HD domain-containing protein [Coriobacteriia bacterium]
MDASLFHDIPEPVRRIGLLLHEAGYDAVLVGGCVRDLLRGVVPADQDLVTSAPTDDLCRLLSADHSVRVVYAVNERFSTLGAVCSDGSKLEISRYRPDALGAPTLEQRFAIDASHRDFTINALGIDLASGALLDPLGGRGDLEDCVLRACGDVDARLAEDPLRAIRAARFVAELRCALAPATRDALARATPSLALVAPERIREELTRLLVAEHVAAGLAVLLESGALAAVLPEVAALDGMTQPSFHDLDVLAHTMQAVALAPATPVMRWAALLHDVGKAPTRSVDTDGRVRFLGHAQAGERMAAAIVERLRFSAAQSRAIVHLVATHMRLGELDLANPRAVDRAVRSLDLHTGEPETPPLVSAEDVISLTLADFGATAHRADVPRVRAALESAVAASRARGTHEPIVSPVSGTDIMAAFCLTEGPQVGVAKHAIEDAIERGLLADDDKEGALVVAAAALGTVHGSDDGRRADEGCGEDAPLEEDPRYRAKRIVRGVVSAVLIIALLLLLVFGVVQRIPRRQDPSPRPVYTTQARG